MSRPLRIEFKGAYYHVMNRGAGRQNIFANDDHRLIYLALLGETRSMYRAEIHAYCLMDNHYHLLLSTPDGNLNRVMRHINGVYTQRYNRLTNTDGPLFRGRYKAILVDADAYLLSVSRYIHLNPVEAGITKKPHQYIWSSYRAFIGKAVPQAWLNTATTLGMVGERSRQQRYQVFVESGVDDDTHRFYEKNKLSPIYGRPSFVKQMEKRLTPHREIPESRKVRPPVSISQLVETTAIVFNVEQAQILKASRGRSNYNVARAVSMYMSRQYAGHSLKDIADYFGLASYGSASGQIHRFRQLMSGNEELQRQVEQVQQKIK